MPVFSKSSSRKLIPLFIAAAIGAGITYAYCAFEAYKSQRATELFVSGVLEDNEINLFISDINALNWHLTRLSREKPEQAAIDSALEETLHWEHQGDRLTHSYDGFITASPGSQPEYIDLTITNIPKEACIYTLRLLKHSALNVGTGQSWRNIKPDSLDNYTVRSFSNCEEQGTTLNFTVGLSAEGRESTDETDSV